MVSEIDWDELDRLGEEQSRDRHFRALDRTLVPGEGDNPIAFIIGEAPGAQEVTARRPFVGPAGTVQRQLMSFAGLFVRSPWFVKGEPESNCWLTNAVKFYPPKRGNNRKPTPQEIAAARPYLRREWVAVGSPKLIIPVGGVALAAIIGREVSIIKYAGKPIERPWGPTIFPMLHPSFGLRGGETVRQAIEDDWERLAEWMRDAHYLL